MNSTKRLNRLSVDDLQELQTAILGEIQRRQEAGAGAHGLLTAMVGRFQQRKELPASVAAPKPAPAVGKPVSPRRAA